MKRLDSSEIVGLIGKAADAFLKSLALLAASPAAMSRVEAFDDVLFLDALASFGSKSIFLNSYYGFCSNRILHYFPLSVCVSVSQSAGVTSQLVSII